MPITICTYNCCSLNKNIDIVRELTGRNIDFVFLQETFIVHEKLGILDFIDENYEVVGIGATISEENVISGKGRPRNGMACLWRKKLGITIVNIIVEAYFIILVIRIGNKQIVMINVYLRSDCGDAASLENYIRSLNCVEQTISDINFDSIYILGDFNADPFSGRAWRSLSNFIDRNSLSCFDVNILSDNTHTYIGYGYANCRWLDHVVGRNGNDSRVTDISVLYELIGSDHLPLLVTVDILDLRSSNVQDSFCGVNPPFKNYVNWKKITDSEFSVISDSFIKNIGNVEILSVLKCTATGCQDLNHKIEIDFFYERLINALISASDPFSKLMIKKDKFVVIPGWNRNVKELHTRARQCYLKWIGAGRGRFSREFHLMSESRKCFKTALKQCRNNINNEISLSIEEKYKNKNFSEFWKEVSNKKEVKKQCCIIDFKTNENDIVDIFTTKFLLNNNPGSNPDEIDETYIINNIKQSWNTSRLFHMKLSQITLRELIRNLNSGVGHDGIHSDFLLRAPDNVLEFLTSFLNVCLSHCYTPKELLKGTINPTIKDKKGILTDSSNYRPVMQSSCILKILEYFILNILKEQMFFNCRQFGFEAGTSTTDVTYVLKELAFKYSRGKGKMFAAFLDMSRAFDRVNHFILAKYLLSCNIAPDIVLFTMNYLRNQSARVGWGRSCGSYFDVEFGVRQGGILSPFLFKFYINSIVDDMNEMDMGCRLGLMRVNLITYADDLVILAPSKTLLDIFYSKLKDSLHHINLNLNPTKSKIVIFSKSRKNNIDKLSLGEDNIDVVDTLKYLGFYLNEQLDDTKDVEFRLNGFYRKFYSVLRNFNNLSLMTVLFLFKSFCIPDYGIVLWNCNSIFKRQIFKSFEIAFGKSFKRMLGVPFYSSTHITAEICELLTLKHHVIKAQLRFLYRLLDTKNRLIKINLACLKSGLFMGSLFSFYRKTYGVSIIGNDLQALIARVHWVQSHEERRRLCPFFERQGVG